MRKLLLVALLLLPSLALGEPDPQQQMMEKLSALKWQFGPSQGKISNRATIKIPKDYAFLDADNTKHFLELMGNPPRDGHYAIAPRSFKWFAVFYFDPMGYVKDDEKIDADALLSSMQSRDATENEERKKLGMAPLYTDGWLVAPHYDPKTHRLEWGLRIRTHQNESIVNYTSRLLGRRGVMSAVLVSDPNSLNDDMVEFKKMLDGFTYTGGEKYAEFKPGDKVAEYGLAALVAGGAAAVAAKSGILKSLGKFLWVIIAGGAAAISAFFKRVFGRKNTT